MTCAQPAAVARRDGAGSPRLLNSELITFYAILYYYIIIYCIISLRLVNSELHWSDGDVWTKESDAVGRGQF